MSDQPELMPHEWLAVLCVMIGLIFIGTLHYLHRDEIPQEATIRTSPIVEVTVEGAVKNPGTFHLKKGARLKELLDQLELLPEADVQKLKRDSILRTGQTIKIPTIFITIRIEGAVEHPGALSVRRGSRLEDLIGLIEFTENADTRPLKKKRLLKDEEIIHVPSKSP